MIFNHFRAGDLKLELHLDSVDGADGGALARWRRHLGGVFAKEGREI